MTIKLFKHQLETVEFINHTPRSFNMSDPGTAKTAAVLSYAIEKDLRTLVLAPKTLLEPAWAGDLNKLGQPDSYAIAYAHNRKKMFDIRAPFTITNIEAVNWLAKKENQKYIDNFDLVICDEVTAFKNPRSMRSKNAGIVFDRIPKAHVMSGTPMTKTVANVWYPMFLLDHGARLGHTISSFRFQWCRPEHPIGAPPGAIIWHDKPGAKEEVAELIADVSIRYTLEECSDVPENNIIWIGYRVKNSIDKAYKDMTKRAITMLEDGTLLKGVNAAVARGKALQILSGSAYYEEGKHSLIDMTRAEMVADLIEARAQSVVVFFIWKHQKYAMEDALRRRKIKYAVIDGTVNVNQRNHIVEDFQAGKYDAVLMHPETGAHGLTLTNARTAIYTTPPGDRPDWLTQGIARVRRIGQQHKTETILLYAEQTFERGIYQAIIDQRDAGQEFIDYIKELTE